MPERKLQYKITANISDAQKKFGTLGATLERTNKNIVKSIENGIGKSSLKLSESLLSKMKYVAAGLTAVSVASVKMAANFEMAKRSMTVLTGSVKAAQEHLNELERFAATTPFEFTGLLDASKRLQAYGFQAKAVIPILEAVGDASMAVGLSQEGIDRMTLAIGQIAAKGKLSAEEMRQIAETGLPAWKMIAEHMGITVAEVMDKTKKGSITAKQALEALFSGMDKKYRGMMSQVAEEIPQTLSNMKDAISVIMREIGSSITKELNLKERLADVATWLTAFGQTIKNSGVSEAITKLVPESFKTGLVVTASVITALMLPALGKLAAAILTVGLPYTILAGVAASAAYLIYTKWDDLKLFFEDFGDSIDFLFRRLALKFEELKTHFSRTGAMRTGLSSMGDQLRKEMEKIDREENEWVKKRQKRNSIKSTSSGPATWKEALTNAKNEIKKIFGSTEIDKNWKELLSNLDSIGGTGGAAKSKGKSAIEIMVSGIRDQMKYLGVDGNKFLGILDKWQAKLKPLSDDWKVIADLKIDIFSENAQKSAAEAERIMAKIKKAKDEAKEMQELFARADSEYLNSLSWENSQGLLSNADYFDILKRKVEELGLATKNVFNWTDNDRATFAAYQSAGSAEFSRSLELLRKRYESGAIGASQYKAEIEKLKQQFAELPLVLKLGDEALAAIESRFLSAAQQANVAWDDAREAIYSVPEGIGNAFESAIRGTESLGDAMLDLLQDLGAVIAKAMIMRALFGGGEGGGFFGSGGGFFGMLGLKFHSGGTVGAGGTPTLVSPSVFANAPRMHGGGIAGLRSDEVPAILQRGEVVQPKNARAGGAAAGGDNYQITIQAIDASSFVKMLQNNKGTIESLIVNGLQRGGSLRMAVKGAV